MTNRVMPVSVADHFSHLAIMEIETRRPGRTSDRAFGVFRNNSNEIKDVTVTILFSMTHCKSHVFYELQQVACFQ
jgi:hypothetical protein